MVDGSDGKGWMAAAMAIDVGKWRWVARWWQTVQLVATDSGGNWQLLVVVGGGRWWTVAVNGGGWQ